MAKEGPESTARFLWAAFGSVSFSTCDTVKRVSCSSPFDALTIIVSFDINSAAFLNTPLTPWDGTTHTTTALPFTASSTEFVGVILWASLMPGKKTAFSLVLSMVSYISSSLTHRVISKPLSASMLARVVPQLPAPRIQTFSTPLDLL